MSALKNPINENIRRMSQISKSRLAVLAIAVSFTSITTTSCIYSGKNQNDSADSIIETVEEYEFTIDGVSHPEIKSEEELDAYLEEHNMTNVARRMESESSSYSSDVSIGLNSKANTKKSIRKKYIIYTKQENDTIPLVEKVLSDDDL